MDCLIMNLTNSLRNIGRKRHNMGSLLTSTLNTRYVPHLPQFIRSDLPWHLTEEDKQWLLDHNFKTAIDLRTEDEYNKWKSDCEDDDSFTVLHMHLTLKDI